MDTEIIIELHKIAESIQDLNVTILNISYNFWDTQWFAALVGALSAIIATIFINFFGKRNQRMKDLYQSLMSNKTWLQPDSLIDQAGCTSYGHTITKNGKTSTVPEKKINEKTVIEFRGFCKYWQFPISRIRYLFNKYEKAIWQLPDRKVIELKDVAEYKNLQKIFHKISNLIEKKTGESEYTHRQK